MSDGPDSLAIGGGVRIPLAEVELRVSRSGGPGGQHANVTASRVEAVFDVAASSALDSAHKRRISSKLGPRVSAVAQDSRSQARNRKLALDRLADRLAEASRPRKRRRPTQPSKRAKRRRVEGKRHRSQLKRTRGKPRSDD